MKVMMTALPLLLLGAVIVAEMPELRRYLKMRKM